MQAKWLSYILAAALCLSPLAPSAQAAQTDVPADASEDAAALDLEEGSYREGTVIVSLAAPGKTPLTREGSVSFDGQMEVDASYNFGSAAYLGENELQRDFLSDKTLYVATVTSDVYSTEELLRKLDGQAYVMDVEPDYYYHKMAMTNDALAGSQWYLNGSDAFSTASPGIRHASASQDKADNTPVVAVVDTGIDYKHEDLADKMWVNTYSKLSGTYGYDFGNNDKNPMDEDESGHGTHCAGVIGAAMNNQVGIAGVADSVKLMALKIFDSHGEASSSYAIDAFNYIYKAQKLGVNIVAVNCSWGGGSSSSTMKNLVQKIGEAGALFIFAAGNTSLNRDTAYEEDCPYDINSPYVVTVGASAQDDWKSGYSDYGSSKVDLFAPGDQILSTVNQNVFFPAILPEEEREAQTTYFSTCGPDDQPLISPTSLGETTPRINIKTLEHTNQVDYFGNTADGCTHVGFTSNGRENTLTLYMDVTDLNLDPTSNYYIAYDVAMTDDGALEWEHANVQRSSTRYYLKKDDRTYLSLITISAKFDFSMDMYFDNISISKANPDVSSFGKYNVYSGTSMAAPSVTGAVALLANTYPKDNAVQRKERLLSCVRKAEGVTYFCRTGGILDLSKIKSAKASPVVKVKKVKLNKKSATLSYSKKLKLKATVTPSNAANKTITWSVSNKKYAAVSKKGVVTAKKKGVGHTVKVTAKAADGSKKKAVCKVKITK